MTKKLNFDIAIVGGGAVGGALALQLHELGFRIAVIESRKPDSSSSDPERVVALSYGSRCHLEVLGVWPGIADTGTGLIRHIHVCEPGNIGYVDMDAHDAQAMQADVEALGYVVEMGQVLAPIYRRMQERITLLTETSLNNLYLADDGITLNITRQGKPQHLHASLVVGVDGTSSQVRTLAGIGTYGWDYNHFGLVASVKTGNGHGDMAYECFCASGPLAFLPLADGRASIVWALTPKEAACMMAMPEPMFLRRLERAAGEDVATQLGRFGSIGKRACFPLELRIAEQFSRPRIALAGNAAHTVHPVAGQGMNLGLRDVAVLGDVLRHKLARNDPGAPVLMRAYAERRRLDTMVVCSFTDSLATGFGSSLPPAKCLRGLGMKGMHMLSPLRNLLLKQAAGIGQMDTLNLQLAKQESSA